MEPQFEPGSFGAHEVHHIAGMLMDMVEEHLSQHLAVAGRLEWLSLSETAHKALFDLYQALGTEHLGASDDASAIVKARARAQKHLEEMTAEEDAAIAADAEADPDNPPADDLISRKGQLCQPSDEDL